MARVPFETVVTLIEQMIGVKLESKTPESVPQADWEDEAIASKEVKTSTLHIAVTKYNTGPIDVFVKPFKDEKETCAYHVNSQTTMNEALKFIKKYK